MNVADAITGLIGNLDRFQPLSDRVEGLVDAQVNRFRPKSSDWLVVPWTNGFYLFSEDMEGQRRGREVVFAFLGPSVVTIETIPDEMMAEKLPAAWKETGLVRASSLRLVGGQANAEKLLSRLEDMVAALGGRSRHTLEIKPSPSDLLRDFRLALIRRDDDAARLLLDEIVLTGYVSAENLRYLRIEYLAAFERWSDMRDLPHLRTMLKARRPRAVSETLLRMVWWTELVGVERLSPRQSFAERDVMGTYGSLLRSVRLPSTPPGRLVGLLCAAADADVARQEEIIGSAVDDAEQSRLRALVSDAVTSPPPVAPGTDPLVIAFEEGRYSEVVDSFLAEPAARYADLAVQAVLESGASEHARNVFLAVTGLDSAGELTLDRRARRDFEELERLANDTCTGWLEWATRLRGQTRWADASSVLRNSAPVWKPLTSLNHGQVSEVCDALLATVAGTNDDQLRASLDLLCGEAASQLTQGTADDFCRTVLLLLSEQNNFSEMVRSAYLDLFAAWLDAGPGTQEYAEIIDQTAKIWTRLKSPNAIGWAIGVLEAVADSPCPNVAVRTALVVEMIEEIRRQYYPRASIREKSEIEELAGQFGLAAQPVEATEDEKDLWSRLNGKLVGIYSLLPRAKALLEGRLSRLCAVGEVKANADEVGTPALRTLAERADFLIVDTWHAKHAATMAIDAVRPRDQQIMPRQRGITGFLRALEAVLGN